MAEQSSAISPSAQQEFVDLGEVEAHHRSSMRSQTTGTQLRGMLADPGIADAQVARNRGDVDERRRRIGPAADTGVCSAVASLELGDDTRDDLIGELAELILEQPLQVVTIGHSSSASSSAIRSGRSCAGT